MKYRIGCLITCIGNLIKTMQIICRVITFPVCIGTKDIDKIVETVTLIEFFILENKPEKHQTAEMF